VIQSIVTPFGASLLCQQRCGIRTRSPVRKRRVVAPCGSSTVNSVSPARTWSSSSALCSSHGGRPEKLVTPHVQPWNSNVPIGLGGSSRALARSTRTIRFTACGLKSWTITSGSSSAEGGTCLSRKPPWLEKSYAHRAQKTFARPRVKFCPRAQRERPQTRRERGSISPCAGRADLRAVPQQSPRAVSLLAEQRHQSCSPRTTVNSVAGCYRTRVHQVNFGEASGRITAYD